MKPVPMQPNMPQATNTFDQPVKPKQWYECSNCNHKAPFEREWAGLTDEEMKQVCYETFSYDPYVIARAIEAKLKEKNT